MTKPHAEPDVEIIVGRIVATANSNFTWGKAPRTLHHTVDCDDASLHIELVSTCKQVLPKIELARVPRVRTQVWIAMPRGSHTPRLDYPPIKMVQFTGEAYTTGVEEVERDGVKLRMYGVAKNRGGLLQASQQDRDRPGRGATLPGEHWMNPANPNVAVAVDDGIAFDPASVTVEEICSTMRTSRLLPLSARPNWPASTGTLRAFLVSGTWP